MTRDVFPPELRARLRPSGPVVEHPGVFPTAPLPAHVDEAIAAFATACEAVGGRVSRARSAMEVVDLIASHLEAPEWRSADRPGPAPFVAWDDAHLPLPGVLALVESRGATRLDARVAEAADTRASDGRRLDAAVLGITGAEAALVDTGSVVLAHGPGRGRLVSLLPPIHVALVSIDRLHATLGACWAATPAPFRDSANVVVVTGPSRTADIEMTLTRGVHGPRLVHVVFVG